MGSIVLTLPEFKKEIKMRNLMKTMSCLFLVIKISMPADFDKKLENMREEFQLEMIELEERLEKAIAMNQEQAAEINSLREVPVIYQCGYQDFTGSLNAYVPYDSLYFSHTNEWTSDGGLDTNTGIFTAPVPGTYIITYSALIDDDDWDTSARLFIVKNEGFIQESKHESAGGTTVNDQGGRTLILHLSLGDRVGLWCTDCSAYVYDILTCFYLASM